MSHDNQAAVHPRACGEHVSGPGLNLSFIGSSPRPRGTRPAMPRLAPPCHAKPVHPRACGEHLFGKKAPNRSTGSSPRLRGTR